LAMVVIAMSGIHVHSRLFVFGNRLHGSIILAATSQFSIYVIRRTELLTVITSQSNTFQDFILICFVAVIGERSHLGIFVPVHAGYLFYVTCFFDGGFAHTTIAVNLYGFCFRILDLCEAV